ncbi:MAG: hypothetical protein DRH37_11695 [Deltaproteobacteria bacterium]|nr:MAG: hypothetical protein DRH37_11695 [Deltaproteobacteria bacterium]
MAILRNPCVNLRDYLPVCRPDGTGRHANNPLISLALRKNSHFRIGDSPVPEFHLWMGTT